MASRTCTWSFIFVFTIYVLAFAFGSEDTLTSEKSENSTITNKIRYSNFRKICSNWSTTTRYSDSAEYELLKYTNYNDRLKDFIKKYPYVVIEAVCEASSDLWDDPNCFKSAWTFETINFLQSQYTNKRIVGQHKNGFGWDVGAEIGFGFKVKEDTLYLRASINGWIYKAGAWFSCLESSSSIGCDCFLDVD